MSELTEDDVRRDAADLAKNINMFRLEMTRIAESPADVTERERMQMALRTVIAFVDSLGIAHETTVPLWWVLTHFSDLDHGRSTDDAFKPARTKGRPHDSKLQQTRRVMAAAVMEAYMRAGLCRDEAAKRAASWFGEDPKQVMRWRVDLTGAPPAAEPQRSQWNFFQGLVADHENELRRVGEPHTRERVDDLARHLAANVPDILVK